MTDVALRTGPDETALLARLRAGDEAAFLALVDRHQPALGRLARSLVPTPAAAAEVVQETWTALLDGLATVEGCSSLRTWLFRVCTNRAREARSVPFSALEGTDSPAHDPSEFEPDDRWAAPPRSWDADAPLAALRHGEALAQLATALEALPPMQRAVLTLRDVEGLSAEEACHVLDLGEPNQRLLLHRARVELRAALAAYVDGERSP